jgi:hypothetical protein
MALVVASGGFTGTPTIALTITATEGVAVAAASSEVMAAITEEATETPESTETAAAPVVRATIPPRLESPTVTRLPSNTPTASVVPTDTATASPAPTRTLTPSLTPTRTNTPTATLPPEGLRGEQNLLALVASEENPAWSGGLFTLGQEGTYWRLGTGAPSDNDVLTIAVPPSVLEARYGNDAAERILRVEAEMELVTWNPPLVIDNEVYFGLVLIPMTDLNRRIGAQVQLVEDGILNYGQRVGDTVTISAQQSVSVEVARIRLEYDRNARLLAVYINNEQVGAPIPLSSEAVIPALYVKEGGVIVHVTRWFVTLR